MNATSDPQAIAEPTAVAIFPAHSTNTHTLLSHRSGRSVKGRVGKRTEAEQRQRQGNFSIQEQEGRGAHGFVRSMSWLWPRASMDDSHAAITDFEAIPT